MMWVVAEWARTAVLPVTFPLIFGVHGFYHSEGDSVKQKILAPAEKLGRVLLPGEIYLSCGE